MQSIPALERVIKRLNITETCWTWTGATFRYGYGNVRRWNGERWTNVSAHIVVWEAANGQPVPAGKVVMHLCDNPACCRPSHLTVGSQAENLHDAARKGRIDWRQLAISHPRVRNAQTGRYEH